MQKNKQKIDKKYLLAFGVVAILCASVFLGVSTGFAQVEDFGQPVVDQTGLAQSSLTDVIARVINIFLGFLGLIALIIIIVAGVIWMTSGGNPQKIQQAKKIMLNAAIGLAIILGAAVIANFIFWIIGRSFGGNTIPGEGPVPYQCVGAECIISAPSDRFKLINHSPSSDEEEVSACRAVQGTFNAKVDETSLGNAFSLENTTTGDVTTASSGGDLAFSEDGKAFRYRLSSGDMDLGSKYHAQVSTSAAAARDAGDFAGLRMATARVWDFTTSSDPNRDENFPRVQESATVYSVSPSESEENVCLHAPIQVIFNEEMDVTTLKSSNILLLDSETGLSVPLRSVSIGNDLKSLTVFPANPLERPTTGTERDYIVRLYTTDESLGHDGFQDVCGNPLAGDRATQNVAADFEWTFTTGNQSTAECQPEIRLVTPTIAKYNQEVSITGARFGLYGEVKIGNVVVDYGCTDSTGLVQEPCVQSWTQERIRVNVPVGTTSDKVSVSMDELSTQSQETVEITSPYVHEVQPNPIHPEELLRLVGKNFGPEYGIVELYQAGVLISEFNAPPVVCTGDPSATWNDHSATVYIPQDIAVGTYSIRLKTAADSDFSNFQLVTIEEGAPRPGFCGLLPSEGSAGISVEAQGINLINIAGIEVAPELEISRVDVTSLFNDQVVFALPAEVETGYIYPIAQSLEKGSPAWFRVTVDRNLDGNTGDLVGDGPEGPGGTETLPRFPRLLWVQPENPSPQNCSIVLGFDRPMNIETVIANTNIEFGNASGVGVSGDKNASFVPLSGGVWPTGTGAVFISSPDLVVDTEGNPLDCDNSPVVSCNSSVEFEEGGDSVARVNITPTRVSLIKEGDAKELTALVAGDHCGEGINTPVSWSAEDQLVAQIIADVTDTRIATVAPVDIGTTYVVATAGEKIDSASVRVTLGPDGPPFYVISARPHGDEAAADESIVIDFNDAVDGSTIRTDALTVTNSLGEIVPIVIDIPSPERIRAIRVLGGVPLLWDTLESYTVQIDNTTIKKQGDPVVRPTCSRARGVNADCSFEFTVAHGVGQPLDINFTEDEYLLEWGRDVYSSIEVIAGYDTGEGMYVYNSSQSANFSIPRGSSYIRSLTDPPIGQRYRIVGTQIDSSTLVPEADIQAAIGLIEDTAPVNVFPCSGNGCQASVTSLQGDRVVAGKTCSASFELSFNKYIDTEAFVNEDVVVLQDGVAVASGQINLHTEINQFSRNLIFEGLSQGADVSSAVTIEYKGESFLPSVDQSTARFLSEIESNFNTAAPSGDPHDVNGDGVIDIADVVDAAQEGIQIQYEPICSGDICKVTYELLSAADCANGGPSGGGDDEDSGPPKVMRVAPVDSAANVCTNVLVWAEFDRNLGDEATIAPLVQTIPDILNKQVTVVGKRLEIRPDVGAVLDSDQAYTIRLNPGEWGTQGEDIICSSGGAGPCEWNFTTSAVQCPIDGVLVAPYELEGAYVDATTDIHIRENMTVAFRSSAIAYSPLMSNVFRCFGSTSADCLAFDQEVGGVKNGIIDVSDLIAASTNAPPLELIPRVHRWSFADPVAVVRETDFDAGTVLIAGERVTSAVETVIRAEVRDPASGEIKTGEYPLQVLSCKNHFVVQDTGESYNERNTNFLIDGTGTENRTPHGGEVTHFSSHACVDEYEEAQYPVRVAVRTTPDRSFVHVHYIQVPNLQTPEEPDAIIILVGENNERASLDEWVRGAKLDVGLESGALSESLTVDGYPAAQNGTSVYINGADFHDGSPDLAFTRTYVLSYNEGAQESTKRIFQDLVNNFRLNTNLGGLPKQKFRRDRQRVFDITNMQQAISAYGSYPQLPAGSFEENHTTSRWNSWASELGARIGVAPLDPLNEFGECSGHDKGTCWNRTLPVSERFSCPAGSHVYQYRYENDGYNIKAKFEFTNVNWASFAGVSEINVPMVDGLNGLGKKENQFCVNVVLHE